MMTRIYRHCAGHAHAPFGRPYMTWQMDLRSHDFAVRARDDAPPAKLARWTFTPHMNDRRQMVAARFRFELEDRDETFFVGEPIAFKGPQVYLTGNEFERSFPAEGTELVTPDQWDLWGRGLSADICRHYEAHIYPRVVDTLAAVAARAPGRPLSIVDVGGGSGTLAAALCASGVPVEAVLVLDRSAELLRQAVARSEAAGGRIATRCVDVTRDDFLDALPRAPDVVVLCGVVAQQVMDRGQGLQVVRVCYERLGAGGFVLVPSYSPALLTSADYEAIGFHVHNRSLHVVQPAARGTALTTNDFYVLERA